MAKFITLHKVTGGKRIYVNIDAIASVEETNHGTYVNFNCSGVSGTGDSRSSRLERELIKESYSQVIFEIEN